MKSTGLTDFKLITDQLILLFREKLKIKKVSDELGDTFDDMLAHY